MEEIKQERKTVVANIYDGSAEHLMYRRTDVRYIEALQRDINVILRAQQLVHEIQIQISKDVKENNK